MSELIVAIQSTPVPAILVIAGILFLFLALGGSINAGSIPPNNKKIFGVFGGAFLLVGIGLYAFPKTLTENVPSPTQQTNITPTQILASPTPTISKTMATYEEDFSNLKFFKEENFNSYAALESRYASTNGFIWETKAITPVLAVLPTNIPALVNFDFSTKINLLQFSGSPEYGIRFRCHDILFNQKGEYQVRTRVQDQGYVYLTDWMHSSALKYDGLNDFKVVAREDKVRFFINDEFSGEYVIKADKNCKIQYLASILVDEYVKIEITQLLVTVPE